jgi:hypothetical protein
LTARTGSGAASFLEQADSMAAAATMDNASKGAAGRRDKDNIAKRREDKNSHGVLGL